MDYKFTFEDGSRVLAHYGVKGMKWGVRNEETKAKYYRMNHRDWGERNPGGYSNKGGTIPKGTTLYRISTHSKDPARGNRLYVSTSKQSQKNWRDYMNNVYSKYGLQTYSIRYKTANDIKVMPQAELGKLYVDKMLKDSKFQKQSLKDLSLVWNEPVTMKSGRAYLPDEHMFYNTKTSSKLYDEARKRGYQAIGDRKGQWLDKDPIIILDVNKNLEKRKVRPTFPNVVRGRDFKKSEHMAKAYDLQVKGA